MENNNKNNKTMEDGGKRVSLSPGRAKGAGEVSFKLGPASKNRLNQIGVEGEEEVLEGETKHDQGPSKYFGPNGRAGAIMGAPKAHRTKITSTEESAALLEASKRHNAAVAAVVAAFEAKQAAAFTATGTRADNEGAMDISTLDDAEDKDKEAATKDTKDQDVEYLEDDDDDDMEVMDMIDEEDKEDTPLTEAPVAAPTGNKRDTVKYVEVSFPVNNQTKGGDVVKPLYAALLSFLKVLNIHNFFVVAMKFKPAKHADATKGAIPLASVKKDLPSGLSQFSIYTSGLRAQNDDNYTCYTTMKIALNGLFSDFMTAAQLHLSEIGAKIFEAPLQFADTFFDGYLAGAHLFMNLKRLQELFTFQAGVIAKQLRIPVIPFALKKKMIWDGKRKDQRPAGWKAQFAIHICFVKVQAATGRAQMKRILNWYNSSGHLNYSIRYVQCLNPFEMLTTMITKNHLAQAWHRRGVESMVHIKTTDVVDFNQLCTTCPLVTHPRYPDKDQTMSAKRYLFSLAPQKAGTGKELVPLFLSIEPTFSGGEYYVTVARRHAAEAEEILKSLGMYMMRRFGINDLAKEGIMKLLSDTGVDRFLSTDWDEKTNTAVPLEDKEQDADILACEVEWGAWADDEVPSTAATPSGGVTGEANNIGKRPHPKETKETFDDKSMFTTASQKTLKGVLADVILGAAPSSEELEAAAEEEEADSNAHLGIPQGRGTRDKDRSITSQALPSRPPRPLSRGRDHVSGLCR